MCPATPSPNPSRPKMRSAPASFCLRWSRSSSTVANVGGPSSADLLRGELDAVDRANAGLGHGHAPRLRAGPQFCERTEVDVAFCECTDGADGTLARCRPRLHLPPSRRRRRTSPTPCSPSAPALAAHSAASCRSRPDGTVPGRHRRPGRGRVVQHHGDPRRGGDVDRRHRVAHHLRGGRRPRFAGRGDGRRATAPSAATARRAPSSRCPRSPGANGSSRSRWSLPDEHRE